MSPEILERLLEEHRETIYRIALEVALRANIGDRIRYKDGRMDQSKFDLLIDEVLAEFGITMLQENSEQLILDVAEYLRLESKQFLSLPVTKRSLAYDADYVFRRWAESSDEALALIHEDTYGTDGTISPKSFILRNGRQLPDVWGCLCQFNGHPCYVHFFRDDFNKCWCVNVRGEPGGDLLLKLGELVDAYFIERYQGKALDDDLNQITVKKYHRESLIYPKKLGEEVDKLTASFATWFASPSVDRWGSILLGGPGTGKTTVGGLLAYMRPDGCTFIYCPAGKLRTAGDVDRIFSLADKLAPALLQIDDIDLVSQDRRQGQTSLTSSLMENLDGLKKGAKVFVIMTSNHPTGMEKAIINRAGRVSGKITFEGYGECLSKFLRQGRQNYTINLGDRVIGNAIRSLPKEVTDLSPDEAMNVCKRLHLIHGNNEITTAQLRSAIEDVYNAFRNSENQVSFLELNEHATK